MSRSNSSTRKKPKRGMFLIGIGLLLAVLAPVTRWVVIPRQIKMPDNLTLDANVQGCLKLYGDPDTGRILAGGEAIEVPFDILVHAAAVPEKSDKEVIVIKTMYKFLAPNEKLQAKSKSIYEKMQMKDEYFALDRRTGKNVPGTKSSDRDRSGFNSVLDIGTEKKSYPLWDSGYGKTVGIDFVKEDRLNGKEYENIRVYVFKQETEPAPTVPPAGLPTEVSLRQALQMVPSGSPTSTSAGLDMNLKLEYLKSIDAIIKVEPRTGMIVDTAKHHEEIYINTKKFGLGANQKILEIDYSTPAVSREIAVDSAVSNFWKLDLVTKWIPLAELAGGLLMIVIGALMLRREHRRNRGEGVQA